MKNYKVLVIGGNGFIGQHVVRLLINFGAEPVIMDARPSTDALNGVETVIGSVGDEALMATLASRCSRVIFLANSSLPGTSNINIASEIRSHVESTIKAAETCEKVGVGRFIFASSGGTVYGDSSKQPLAESCRTVPRNAYGASKLSIENYLRIIRLNKSMSTVSLRISNPYGEGQRALRNQGFIAAAMEALIFSKPMTIWGDGLVERDFIYVGDVARAFVLACMAESPPDVINIGFGQAHSLLNVMKHIENILGVSALIKFEPGRSIDVYKNVLDISLAQKSLGWRPKVSIVDGLSQTAAWWRDFS